MFRFFFIRSLLQSDPDWSCQTEWRDDKWPKRTRVDLLAQNGTSNLLIEFKLYTYSGRFDLDGRLAARKGGPSRKNCDEFCACVDRRRQLGDGWITGKYLVLVYCGQPDQRERLSYADFHDRLELPECRISCVKPRRMVRAEAQDSLVYRLIEVP